MTFFTLSYFGQAAEISLSASLLVILVTGTIIFAANKSEDKKHPVNF
ncbi:MAG TPA: hypothetical protein VGJ92_05160 [Methanocella sp.]